jgi:hypothetical protein
LRGELDDASAESGIQPPPGSPIDTRPPLMGQVAAARLIAGLGFLNIAEAVWANAIGAACMVGFVATGFARDGRDDTPSTRQTTDP